LSSSLKNHLLPLHQLHRQQPPARLASEQLHPCPCLLIFVYAKSLCGIYYANCGALTPVAVAMVRVAPLHAPAPSPAVLHRSNVCLVDNCSVRKRSGRNRRSESEFEQTRSVTVQIAKIVDLTQRACVQN
jgi:hypothetical protein